MQPRQRLYWSSFLTYASEIDENCTKTENPHRVENELGVSKAGPCLCLSLFGQMRLCLKRKSWNYTLGIIFYILMGG